MPHPVFAQTVFDIIHGAAYPFAACVLFPVMHGQRYLGKFGAHAQQRAHPHPKQRAGAAQANSARHAGHIAGAHGRRQGGADRLEGGDGVLTGVFFGEGLVQGGFHSVAEFPELKALEAQRQKKAHPQDHNHDRPAPDHAVDGAVDIGNRFQQEDTPFSWV